MVTTPAEMIARSGTRLTLPVALMSSRVPAIGRAIATAVLRRGRDGGQRGGADQQRQHGLLHLSLPETKHRAAGWPRRDGLC